MFTVKVTVFAAARLELRMLVRVNYRLASLLYTQVSDRSIELTPVQTKPGVVSIWS